MFCHSILYCIVLFCIGSSHKDGRSHLYSLWEAKKPGIVGFNTVSESISQMAVSKNQRGSCYKGSQRKDPCFIEAVRWVLDFGIRLPFTGEERQGPRQTLVLEWKVSVHMQLRWHIHVCRCRCNIDIYIWYPPPQRPRFSYINIQSGRWGSQSEIDGMGLRVGGFRV